ncbi:MAG: DNA polymerase III subunit [Legionella sp.]|nr:DNA polymerase III subunit [Legionella sp.]
MITPELPDLMPIHASFWNRFEAHRQQQRLSHALLIIGSLHMELRTFATQMAAALLCKQTITPCGACQSCQLISIGEHPDLNYIIPEKSGSVIKIEQVRLLQNIIYTSAQLSDVRVVIIEPAEKMNSSASNALLKILEEPPANTYFILIAEQISTIPPTIISRCQQWRIAAASSLAINYLEQGKFYAAESGRGRLFAECHTIVENLTDMRAFKYSVNALALKWSALEFSDLIWLLYLINAQMINACFLKPGVQTPIDTKIAELAKSIKPTRLFAQLDKLNEIMRNLNHTLSINQLLTLEDLLFGYL